jgi:adenine-specific DNA-methyltransferase
MSRKKTTGTNGGEGIEDYRHSGARRKNNPPAKIAAEGVVPPVPPIEYAYSPRRPPTLRFDPTGSPDKLPELLERATKGPLSKDEARILADALRTQEPWLEWAGKRESEAMGLTVDPVALNIHERISAQAILKVAARLDVERTLFGDPEQEYHEAVQFYRHDIAWTNRMILGDSLQVMASLARREDLAGKVQMIYIDPPYGIKHGSNFQTEIDKREVKDRESDLTRELETVKAYRDTWHLGVHSYLSYLRDRLVAAKELLSDSGSLFVQINEEHVHRVRMLLDEQFGPDNFISQITFSKTTGATVVLLPSTSDYILWYARNRERIKYRRIFATKNPGKVGAGKYDQIMLASGFDRALMPQERASIELIPPDSKIFATSDVASQSIGREKGEGAACWFPVRFNGRDFRPSMKTRWKTNEQGMLRSLRAERFTEAGNTIRYIRFLDDFPAYPITDTWTDIGGIQSRTDPKVYVVQTATTAIERCMLMTTDPGDLVLDPTCGSGTTAYVAEQRGRRWITIDTSRVAMAIARQRLFTAKFDYYRLRDEHEGVAGNFKYKTVPHITLKSIAQNTNLDPIFAKHEPILEGKLATCNAALSHVTPDVRRRLDLKLIDKERAGGKRSLTDADRRRWELPQKGQKWEHWTVPFDADPDWPPALTEAVSAYRKAWRAKMDEVNACIAANAEQEELVDQPEKVPGIVRVSGPFTVEAVQPPELSLGGVADGVGRFGGEPEELEDTFTLRPAGSANGSEAKNAEAYLDQMLRLLRLDGVRFPDNKVKNFSRLERVAGSESGIQAEGRWASDGEADPDPEGRATVAVAFGPQYGPVTARQVEDVIRSANRRGYDDLVVAGFSFDGPAQAIIQEAQHPRLRIHMANIRPDVNPGMNGLLKEQPGSQLFTVFGQPRTTIQGPDRLGEYKVAMEGVDIYDPLTNTIRSTEDQKVAAWFLDSDYDGRTFCITQAFFPDRSAWEKLSKALGGLIDPDRFEALTGTVSLPFPVGKHKCVAVKVIDPRGNEVMQVHRLGGHHG